MRFIAHRRFRGFGLEQWENIPYGTALECRDGTESGITGNLLYLNGHAVCAPFSQSGIEHFAIDDDGRGLERGALTWAIAFSPRKSAREGARFSEEEADMIVREHGHWLIDGGDGFINFNDRFYAAPVEELEELARKLRARPRKEK